jgi:tetratricopeptide (TPR) repeat protein
MKVFRFLASSALFWVIFLLSLNTVSAGEGWTRVRSENFNLIGNADETAIRDVAVKLEQFRATLGQVAEQLKADSPVPTTVIVFKTAADYKPFKPLDSKGETRDYVAGYFQSGKAVNYITLSTEGEPARAYQIIFHEYTHFLVRNNMGESRIPPWYNEGLALYYETLSIESGQKVTVGSAQNKLLTLLRKNELIPLDIFFNTDNGSLHNRGEEAAGLYYAQAWILMHYLRHVGGGARAQQLDKFLNLVLSGRNSKSAFAESFQIEYDALESELKKYIQQKNFPVKSLTLKNKLNLDSKIESVPISQAEASAYLGDLLLHLNRLDEAEMHLDRALKSNPNQGMAQASLGLLKLKQNDFEGGLEYLEKAVAADSKNYLVHFYYAYALSREAVTGFGFVINYDRETARKMRESLKKSIELNPKYAEAYDLYAFISIVRNEALDEAIEYLNKALEIAPGNQWYQIHLAELFLRKEDFGKARNLAAVVSQTASEKELKVYAQNTLQRINGTEAAYESIRDYYRTPRKNPLDKDLSDDELAQLRARQIMESLNEALYKTKPNERRILGFLTQINCGQKDKIYLIKTANQTLRLRSPSFDTVRFTAFTSEMAEQHVGCGEMKLESLVVINYRPVDDFNSKTAGEVVSIEFVPPNFRFIN